MKKFAIFILILLLVCSLIACVPKSLLQGFETTAQTEDETELITEKQTNVWETEQHTEQETQAQTQAQTTQEETTYGPLHFPKQTTE